MKRLLMADIVEKLRRASQWRKIRIGESAHANHPCATRVVGESILRRTMPKIVFQQNRPLPDIHLTDPRPRSMSPPCTDPCA